ncbi:complement C1q-like protein 2 [Alosa sapidissima]|uniref:complement C1q-like protein 2 n=1 Tax=Alosa sapidissima TaxID=34773 RepID=UPI001C09C5FC|nr:complement C1q-like protein 2 [Alosa sapidissima]
MTTCGALLVLLCCCLVQLRGETISDTDTASTQQSCQPDIHTVLREMSAVVVEQRVELRYTKTQVEAMETRLRASEKTVEEQRVELRQTEARLRARMRDSEKIVEEQRAVIKELKEKQEEQAAAVRAVGGRVHLTGSQVEELRREREKRRVAFSASLVASGDETFGPFKDATPLVFKNPFINIGSAYNPNTGVFTAPVRGVYHFVFFIFGNGHASTATGVSLYKNAQHAVTAYSKQASMYVKPSNGASLLLEVGDVVYLKLWPNSWVRDNGNFHTTFSGHLLFPM